MEEIFRKKVDSWDGGSKAQKMPIFNVFKYIFKSVWMGKK